MLQLQLRSARQKQNQVFTEVFVVLAVISVPGTPMSPTHCHAHLVRNAVIVMMTVTV
jgi:hypothetical protein